MEPPAPAAPPLSSTVAAAAATTAAAHPNNYTESIESSPRSRNADSWDDASFPSIPGSGPKIRLMCSYGGHIVPRPHDKSLCYVGGDTRIVVSDRYSSLSDLTHRLSKTLLNGKPFTLKYQLPNEDLDSLISVTTDEDLDNMIEEYDRFNSNAAVKSSRLRLFLFPSKPESIGSLLEDSTKSEDWFVNALNSSSSRGFSESASVNCLLGLDDDDVLGNSNSASAAAGKDVEVVKGGGGGGLSVHSVPDSPMLETSSSFGSTSSSPSLANLPPIRVHVADDQKREGIEEQFAHLSIVVGAPPPVSSPRSTTLLTTAAAVSGFSGEYTNRVLSDDERSGEGMGYGYRKLPQQSQPQPPQLQTKPTGGLDLPSLDSISSDNSLTNPFSTQRPLIYQEPVIQNAFPVDSKLSEPNSGVQLQHQFDEHHQQLNQQQQQLNQQQQQQLNQQQQQQLNQQQQQQLNQQQQQQLNQQHHQQLNQQHHQHLNQQHHQLSQQHYQQQQQQQLNQHHQHQQQLNQQQFLQAGTHYAHHHPSGPAPITSYYQLYPPQQQPLHQLDQQYHHPMYYLPTARHTQPYNFVVQQPNYNEDTTTNSTSSHPQAPPPPSGMPMPPSSSYTTSRNPPASSRPELVTGMYRTATPAAAPLVQAPSAQHQQQYVGFSQIHHHRPSHSAAGNSGNPGTYAYEFVDPAQLYYPHPMAPQLAAQYQTTTSGPTMVLPEASTQLPTDNTKQQITTSKP